MRCSKCYGSGKIMGNGMIYENCDCDRLSVTITDKPKAVIDKRSKEYKEAIGKIMISNDIDRDGAAKVFESEFHKIA